MVLGFPWLWTFFIALVLTLIPVVQRNKYYYLDFKSTDIISAALFLLVGFLVMVIFWRTPALASIITIGVIAPFSKKIENFYEKTGLSDYLEKLFRKIDIPNKTEKMLEKFTNSEKIAQSEKIVLSEYPKKLSTSFLDKSNRITLAIIAGATAIVIAIMSSNTTQNIQPSSTGTPEMIRGAYEVNQWASDGYVYRCPSGYYKKSSGSPWCYKRN